MAKKQMKQHMIRAKNFSKFKNPSKNNRMFNFQQKETKFISNEAII